MTGIRDSGAVGKEWVTLQIRNTMDAFNKSIARLAEKFENLASNQQVINDLQNGRLQKLEEQFEKHSHLGTEIVAGEQRAQIEKLEETVEWWKKWQDEVKSQLDKIIPGSERLDRLDDRCKLLAERLEKLEGSEQVLGNTVDSIRTYGMQLQQRVEN